MFNGAETMNLKCPTIYTVCQLDVVKFGIDLYNLQLRIQYKWRDQLTYKWHNRINQLLHDLSDSFNYKL